MTNVTEYASQEGITKSNYTHKDSIATGAAASAARARQSKKGIAATSDLQSTTIKE